MEGLIHEACNYDLLRPYVGINYHRSLYGSLYKWALYTLGAGYKAPTYGLQVLCLFRAPTISIIAELLVIAHLRVQFLGTSHNFCDVTMMSPC